MRPITPLKTDTCFLLPGRESAIQSPFTRPVRRCLVIAIHDSLWMTGKDEKDARRRLSQSIGRSFLRWQEVMPSF